MLILALLAACDRAEAPADPRPIARAEQAARTQAEDDGRLPCARGDAALERACTVDQVRGDHGLELTLRHPDGGFHRLLVTRDGRGVVAADGAEPARVSVIDAGTIEVALAGDRYRLPATVARR